MEQKNPNKMKIIKVIIVFSIIALMIIIGIIIKCFLTSEESKKANNSDIIEDNTNKNDIQNSNEIENMDTTTDNEVEIENEVISNNTINDDNTNNSNKTTENKTITSSNSTTQTTTNNVSSDNNTTNYNTNATTRPTTTATTSSSTGKTSTSSTASSSTTTTTSKPYYVKSEDEEILTNTETKYGVIIKTYTTITYSIYSDGSKKEAGRRTRTEYDMSKYVEDNAQLLADAKTMKSSNAGLINEVVSYTNQYRKEANEKNIDGITDRNELTLDSNLTIAACARAVEMAYSNTYSHTRPNGKACYTIINDLNLKIGGSFGGENIYLGPSTARSASEGWKNSEGHYSNMISNRYSKIGVGVTRVNGKTYWVQLFAY